MGKSPATAYKDIPLLEWICSALGLIVVLSFLIFTIFQAIMQDNSPPDPRAEIVSTEKVQQGYRVRVRVYNRGGKAAAGLRVEGRLVIAGQEVQSADFSLDYLAAKSQGEGGLFFSEDPRKYDLQLRAVGYHQP